MKTHQLHFRWTISKGRNSYGYNICTLLVDGKKVSACNGGGYDMQGTCLGEWLARAYSERLLKLTESFYGLTFHNPNYDPSTAIIDGKTVAEREAEGQSVGLERYQAFYSASSKVPTEQHTIPMIDGASGFSSVERIAEAIGITFKWIPERSSNHSYYTAFDFESPAYVRGYVNRNNKWDENKKRYENPFKQRTQEYNDWKRGMADRTAERD